MTDYQALPGLRDVYLEDSWVLSIACDETALVIDVDFVLMASHPRYQVPLSGEQYCYRRGSIRFEGVTDLSWTGRGAAPAVDASGGADFGSFDEFTVAGDTYSIAGDFGRIVLTSSPPEVGLL